ncbi:MAG: gamma carbonic anhydrase family protein, partial [Proteobacteria bacterium]|nr:gamma carbonic anhydrase family protein [Pseudomonadota bacterium]
MDKPTRPSSGGVILPYKGVLPRIADDAFIAPTAVIIGDVEIGPEAGVWFGCILRGDQN